MKKKQPKKPRSQPALIAIFERKGTPMRDRRLRRPNDARRTREAFE